MKGFSLMWFWLAYIISETFLFLYILVTYVLSHNIFKKIFIKIKEASSASSKMLLLKQIIFTLICILLSIFYLKIFYSHLSSKILLNFLHIPVNIFSFQRFPFIVYLFTFRKPYFHFYKPLLCIN